MGTGGRIEFLITRNYFSPGALGLGKPYVASPKGFFIKAFSWLGDSTSHSSASDEAFSHVLTHCALSFPNSCSILLSS